MTSAPDKPGIGDPNSVRKAVTVEAPLALAWKFFTEKMGTWWPLAVYKIGKANAVDAIIEPHVGGRWYELGVDGKECDTGRVLAFEPPDRLMLAWHLNGNWQYDPDPEHASEVELKAACR